MSDSSPQLSQINTLPCFVNNESSKHIENFCQMPHIQKAVKIHIKTWFILLSMSSIYSQLTCWLNTPALGFYLGTVMVPPLETHWNTLQHVETFHDVAFPASSYFIFSSKAVLGCSSFFLTFKQLFHLSLPQNILT